MPFKGRFYVSCRWIMALTVLFSISGQSGKRNLLSIFALASRASSSATTTTFRKPWGLPSKHKHLPDSETPQSVKLIQVQIIHRHGDRTPITPLKNESYWATALPEQDILQRVSNNTQLIREGEPASHQAGGRGVFGQLSQLGLLQMVDLGSRLREELSLDDPPEDGTEHHVDEKGNRHIHHGRLFHPKHLPLHPRHVTVKSTDFPRTIQSVQGVLVGLFPDAPDETLRIDVRHTTSMIPDPQPRRSKEQEDLERQLSSQPHFIEREEEMKELAMRATLALKPMLGDGADEVSYGVGEEHSTEDAGRDSKPLAWTQLAEISKCLQVRNLLPETITAEDQESISNHAAWKWMETLRHPRLVYLAMNPMVSSIVESMKRRLDGDLSEALHIHSAHDSTLIGLLAAFRLDPPRVWPEYGSYLKIELLEVGSFDSHDQLHDELEEHHYFVRFSLNGEVLHMKWDPEHEDEPLEIIPLELLMEKVSTVGAS